MSTSRIRFIIQRNIWDKLVRSIVRGDIVVLGMKTSFGQTTFTDLVTAAFTIYLLIIFKLS